MTPRSILIAGASGGLGSAIGRRLGTDRLTLVGRDAERLAATRLPGRRVALDLRDPIACRSAVDAAWTHGGERLDVVINAVGVVAFGSIDELDVDTLEELFLTNTFLPVFLAKAAMERLEPGGVFVNISGVIAEQNLPGMAAYGASKAAVRSFDEAFAREARRRKIRVVDVRPPHTETGLADRAIAGTPPRMPEGLSPDDAAARIVAAIDGDETDVGSEHFT